MTEQPYVGEIRMFAGNFAPRGWAMCNGQLLAISDNDALFSLLGTIYGGDGRTSFALPDFRGKLPLHQGTGPGLSPRRIGQQLGAETTGLTYQNLPRHTHKFRASTDDGNSNQPTLNVLGTQPGDNDVIYLGANEGGELESFDSNTITTEGAGVPHTNLMPAQCLSFIIALIGIYPSRH